MGVKGGKKSKELFEDSLEDSMDNEPPRKKSLEEEEISEASVDPYDGDKLFKKVLLIGLALRAGLLMISAIWDSTQEVKMEDIDYKVYTDGAGYVMEGRSPYDRLTYRYTPLLAWIMTPNIFLTRQFGKFLFSICDMLTSLMIYKILKKQDVPVNQAVFLVSLHTLNVFMAYTTVRGSVESLILFFIIGTSYFILRQNYVVAGFFYGFSIHFRIYPIIYATTFYLFIDHHKNGTQRGLWAIFNRNFITINRLTFTFWTVSVLGSLTMFFYMIYGYEFLYETYLYHFIRKDNRHNFSMYFYLMYYMYADTTSSLIGTIAFLPQWILVFGASFYLYMDLYFALFIQTISFVTFNKVITA
jgi:phosphatidylinositol glycan class M